MTPDTQKVQDNIVIGRHLHICRESRLENEQNITKIVQKTFAEDFLFQSISDTSPLIRRKTTNIHSINPKNYHEKNRRSTNYFNTLHSYQQLPPQLVKSNINMSASNNSMTTSSNSIKNTVDIGKNNDKKGLILAGVFQTVVKNSSIPKNYDGADTIKSLTQREELSKDIDKLMIHSNIEDGDDEEKCSDFSSDYSSSYKNKDSSNTDDDNDSINIDLKTKKKEHKNGAKGVFDLLDDKNQLVDKYLEFNRSFIYNNTMPSIK